MTIHTFWQRARKHATTAVRPAIIGALILITAARAAAGPAYKKFEDCIAACPNEILGSYPCFLRCALDYGDNKTGSPGMAIDPDSSGFGQLPVLNGPGLNLASYQQATISVEVPDCGLTVCPTPLSVDYLLVTWPVASGSFGTLIGSSSDQASGYAVAYNPRVFPSDFGIIVAQARFTSDPLEDIDNIAAIFFLAAPLTIPTLTTSLLMFLATALALSGVLLLRKIQ